MSEPPSLEVLRERIDALDGQLHQLLNERARLALQVADIKTAGGEAASFYRPEREAQILRAVRARNAGPLDDAVVERLFREIISACLALEQPLRVAYLGPEGTFTQEAALKHFGQSIHAASHATIEEVFREVEAGDAAFGVVPVENSTEGVVNHTLDMFIRSPLGICGEVELPVHHHLLARSGGLQAVTRVYAHQQALAQCREWLATHLPRVATEAVSSNGEAARLAAASDGVAAIASRLAAERYDLQRLASNIEDKPDNTTRFLVIGRQTIGPSGEDKTSLMLSVHNRAGALYKLLEPLARAGVSMTKIESRPSRLGKWEYVFFIDVQGHREEAAVGRALTELEADAALFRVLGSYPRVAK